MTNDIRAWLENLGIGQYAAAFIENDVDLDILGDLTDQDLKELGVSLGHRKRIMRAVGETAERAARRQPGKSEGAERRQLTIMFCDLVDSTQLSERFDPEDLRAIIGSVRKCCEGVVERYGGSVARYMGDGLLVYFGYPQADEYDPERAVRAGLEIIQAVRGIDAWPDLALQTRVGIATGEVIVGDLIGEGRSQEHDVVGQTPNLAARLQSIAEPDSVVVGGVTRKLVGSLFEYNSLGLHTLKGFEQPVECWRVDHELDVESRFDARHVLAGMSPMLGRAAEFDLLERSWDEASAGNARAVHLIGDPGIGKSRLIHSLREHKGDKSHTLVTYYCQPFRQDSPLFPVAAQLERAAGFERDDDTAARLDKLEVLVGSFTDEVQDIVPLFAELLGISSASRYAPLSISPQLLKTRTMAALEQHLASRASAHPLLVIFEDLHWVDPTTLELIEQLIHGCAKLPVLFVLTSRPEFQWPTSADEKMTKIELGCLDDAAVRKLVLRVAGDKSLPDEVVKQIVEKTDGVPLFVEELTKNLMESQFLVERDDRFELNGQLPEFTLPDTLQDSLMARLDRMKEGKTIAQLGAAIGRNFSYELVSAVSGFSEDSLLPAIEELIDSELVHQDGTPPLATYVFKHALIQDAAYSSLIRSERQKLHDRIADALERHFPDTGKNDPDTLAHHYTEADKPLQAIPYWHSAAKQAIERGHNEESLKNIEYGMKLLAKLPDGEERSQFELGLCVSRGVALESTRGYASPEVEQTYARASELCEELGNTFDFVPVLLGLYVFNLVRGDLETARELAERCVALSKEAKRIDGLIEAYAALGFVLCYLGSLDEARETLEQCIALYDAREDAEQFASITAQDPAAASRSILAVLFWILGDPDESVKQLDKAFLLAKELHRPINQAVVHTHAAELYQLRRETRLAQDHAAKGLQIASDHGDGFWGSLCAMHGSIAKSKRGHPEEGVAEIKHTLDLWSAAGAGTNTPYFLMRIAEAEHAMGLTEQAMHTVGKAIDFAESTHEGLFASELYRLRGELALASDSPDEQIAEACFLQAIETAQQQGAQVFEHRATKSFCRLRQSQGREARLPSGQDVSIWSI